MTPDAMRRSGTAGKEQLRERADELASSPYDAHSGDPAPAQCGFEVKWGFKKGIKPRHLRNCVSLDKSAVPLFLASLSFA